MTWGKVSDRLHAHSKARRAREAMALWVLALSWCCDELTDGAVPSDMPELLIPGGDAMAEKLVSVGLWERTEAGFRFHDWAEYQPSAEDERERRASVSKVRSDAGKRGAAKRWQTDSKRHGKPMANGSQNDSPVPEPVPEPKRESAARSSRASDEPATKQPATAAGGWWLDPWAVANRLRERSGGKLSLTLNGHERELSRTLATIAAQRPRLADELDHWAALVGRGEASWWTGALTIGALLGRPDETGKRTADGLIRCLEETSLRMPSKPSALRVVPSKREPQNLITPERAQELIEQSRRERAALRAAEEAAATREAANG
jgi:hypothetical protein